MVIAIRLTYVGREEDSANRKQMNSGQSDEVFPRAGLSWIVLDSRNPEKARRVHYDHGKEKSPYICPSRQSEKRKSLN